MANGLKNQEKGFKNFHLQVLHHKITKLKVIHVMTVKLIKKKVFYKPLIRKYNHLNIVRVFNKDKLQIKFSLRISIIW